MELLDQGLKAIDALSASDLAKEHNTISRGHSLTEAGENCEFYTDLGLDVSLIYERFTEFGSKALLFSYTDHLLLVVYYNEYVDKYTYKAFPRDELENALLSYMDDY